MPAEADAKFMKPLFRVRLAPCEAMPKALMSTSSGSTVVEVVPEPTVAPLPPEFPVAVTDRSVGSVGAVGDGARRSAREKKLAAFCVGVVAGKLTVMVPGFKALVTGPEKISVLTPLRLLMLPVL